VLRHPATTALTARIVAKSALPFCSRARAGPASAGASAVQTCGSCSMGETSTQWLRPPSAYRSAVRSSGESRRSRTGSKQPEMPMRSARTVSVGRISFIFRASSTMMRALGDAVNSENCARNSTVWTAQPLVTRKPRNARAARGNRLRLPPPAFRSPPIGPPTPPRRTPSPAKTCGTRWPSFSPLPFFTDDQSNATVVSPSAAPPAIGRATHCPAT